jgi:glucoamylase
MKTQTKLAVLGLSLSLVFELAGLPGSASAFASGAWKHLDLSTWIETQYKISRERLYENISPKYPSPEKVKGSVLASPSQVDPDYYFHWIRDAALVMDPVLDIAISRHGNEFSSGVSEEERRSCAQMVLDYAAFSRQNQLADALSGLGEPKFYVNGKPYDLPWGRPQNDGPALRAITLIKLAGALVKAGKEDFVRKYLYDSKLPTHSLIKTDLEYVAKTWRNSTFDLWEEVKGQHFYTWMVQRRALREGSQVARYLGDEGAAVYYESIAHKIDNALEEFWRPDRGYVIATINQTDGIAGGINDKYSNLDIAVVLGVLHGTKAKSKNEKDISFSVLDDRIVTTAYVTRKVFQQIYRVNVSTSSSMGAAIGRYPEDRYYGGNPWVLTTLAMGEYLYRLERAIFDRGVLKINGKTAPFYQDLVQADREALKLWEAEKYNISHGILEIDSNNPLFSKILILMAKEADSFFERVKYHALSDGGLSEQIHRDTGYMTSARDLSWNYAAFMTTYWARKDSSVILNALKSH